MPLEGLIARINAQKKEMRNGDYIRDMVKDARFYIANNTPEKSGQMSRNLRVQTGPRETAQGFVAGLGPRSRVGNDRQPAPRGTIYQFLRDYPQFTEGGTGNKVSKAAKGKHGFVWRGAWQSLSANAKRLLQEKREQGLYGGSQDGAATDKSPWFFVQEGSLPPWKESADKALIHTTYFLQTAMEQWGTDGLNRMRNQLIRRTGWKRG